MTFQEQQEQIKKNLAEIAKLTGGGGVETAPEHINTKQNRISP
jgi:hypothetical protein